MAAEKIIRPLIETGTTVMVTCFDCCLDLDIFGDQRIYRHTSLANILYDNDETHREIIYHYVVTSGCTNIVIIGNEACSAIDRIMDTRSPGFHVASYRRELMKIHASHHLHFAPLESGRRMLAERIILKQCDVISRYPFILERLEKREISIHGLLIDTNRETSVLYRNGVRFNDLVSSN